LKNTNTLRNFRKRERESSELKKSIRPYFGSKKKRGIAKRSIPPGPEFGGVKTHKKTGNLPAV